MLADAQQASKIRHIGLSKVTLAQIEDATRIAPIAAVQNRYNLTDGDDDVVLRATRHRVRALPTGGRSVGQFHRPTGGRSGIRGTPGV